MREGPALRVLPREPYRDALLEQRCERQSLRLAPVDPSLGEGLASSLELLRKLGVHLEPGRDLQQLLVQRAQPLDRHRSDHGVSGVPWHARLPWRLGIGEGRAELVVCLPQRLEGAREELRRILRR